MYLKASETIKSTKKNFQKGLRKTIQLSVKIIEWKFSKILPHLFCPVYGYGMGMAYLLYIRISGVQIVLGGNLRSVTLLYSDSFHLRLLSVHSCILQNINILYSINIVHSINTYTYY